MSIAFVLSLLILFGCASFPRVPISPAGTVIDVTTGEPLANAFVVARFIGDGPAPFADPGAGLRNKCFGSFVTMTDGEGKFDFSRESPSKLFTDRYNNNLHVDLTAYKPGYSHETDKGFRSWLSGNLVLEKHERATHSGVTLSMTPKQKSAHNSWYERLDLLPEEFCGSDSIRTRNHRLMLQSMTEEAQELAKTSQDWVQAWRFCNIMNSSNAGFKTNEPTIDCDAVYKPKVEALKNVEFARVKEQVKNLDWGDGPKMELFEYRVAPLNGGKNAFVIPDKPEGLDAGELISMLQKVCNSDYPGDFVHGWVCIYFGEEPKDTRNNKCHVLIQVSHMEINHGIAKGKTLKLNEGWCPKKMSPHYYR